MIEFLLQFLYVPVQLDFRELELIAGLFLLLIQSLKLGLELLVVLDKFKEGGLGVRNARGQRG